MKVVGYTDPLSVRAGESIAFKVSSKAPQYSVQIRRLIHGDENPAGPGFKAVGVDALVNQRYEGKDRPLHRGSYIGVANDGPLRELRSFTISAWIFPTAMGQTPQAILGAWAPGQAGYGLMIDESSTLQLQLAHRDGRRCAVRAREPLHRAQWHFVAAALDVRTGVATLFVKRHADWSVADDAVQQRLESWADWGPAAAPFLIAAGAKSHDGTGLITTAHFNGKIERPIVQALALDRSGLRHLAVTGEDEVPASSVACWDFGANLHSRAIQDRSTNRLHGATVNFPTRSVSGRGWTGATIDPARAPDQFAAIHFHNDDLDDAGWPTDFAWNIPSDVRSGVYAAELTTHDGGRDLVPFFVRPARGRQPEPVLVLIPTFSYLAYANDHNAADKALQESLEIGPDFVYPSQPEDHYIVEHGLTGLYDRHTDGTPVVYSSRLRPNLTMRPTYRQPLLNEGRGGPHQLPADLHLIDWLEHFQYGYDLVTDEDVHHEGVLALAGHKVVITGTHPEYWSGAGLDALWGYLQGGGRMMYVGGNGFYWVTSLDPERQHTIEVRKWGGTAAFEVPPGAVFHSTTGELGGLWRFRGRYPQRLAGVGMSAQGVSAGVGYRRLPDSTTSRAAFIFAGVADDALIGDHACLVNEYGAGGYEIDRADEELGTPRHALRLATTLQFSDKFQAVSEEITIADSKQGGTVNPRVRADMVYFEGPNNGAVWSTGSISWCGALSFNGYDNAVSRITRNVLNEFLRRP